MLKYQQKILEKCWNPAWICGLKSGGTLNSQQTISSPDTAHKQPICTPPLKYHLLTTHQQTISSSVKTIFQTNHLLNTHQQILHHSKTNHLLTTHKQTILSPLTNSLLTTHKRSHHSKINHILTRHHSYTAHLLATLTYHLLITHKPSTLWVIKWVRVC